MGGTSENAAGTKKETHFLSYGELGFERGDPSNEGCTTPLNKGEMGDVASEKPHIKFVFNDHNSYALSMSNNGWIFYCGATDTMSYDPRDFLKHDRPKKNPH